MSVLREIQDAAVDPHVSVEDLLREGKDLAVEVGAEAVAVWIESELNGYPSEESAPPYRCVGSQVSGCVLDCRGAQAIDVPMAGILPRAQERPHESPHQHTFTEPVATLLGLIAASNDGTIRLRWPPIFTLRACRHVCPKRCTAIFDVYKVVGTSAVKGIIATVRTKMLEFALSVDTGDVRGAEASPVTAVASVSAAGALTTTR